MKNLFLIALLFILVTSKIEKINKSLLSTAKTFLLEEDFNPLDYNPCEEATNANTCKQVKISDFIPGSQCCYIKAKVNDESITPSSEGICEPNIYPFAPYANLAKSSQFIPFVREVLGFAEYGPVHEDYSEIDKYWGLKGTFEIDCKDSKLDLNVELKEFSQEEKNQLASTDHCLYDIYEIIAHEEDPFPPQESTQSIKSLKCKERYLLKSSTDAGIECGDMKVVVKQNKETLFDINTCMPFNYDLFSKIKIPKELTSFIKKNSEGGNVVVEIKDSKGRKFVFNSNRGGFIWISKYLLILFALFLF